MKYRSLKTWFLGILLVLCACINVQAEVELRGVRYSVNDGLPANVVNDITQDEDGFLWIATNNGLSRWDGYSFYNIPEPSFNENTKGYGNVALLFNDAKNHALWVYSSQHTLSCYDYLSSRFVDYTNRGDDARPFYNRFRSKSGIWLHDGTNGVRYITRTSSGFDAEDFNVSNGLLPNNKNTIIVEDSTKNVWVGTKHGLLRISADGKQMRIDSEKDIYAFASDGHKQLILRADGSVRAYDVSGRLVANYHLPAALGIIGEASRSFTWRGKWIIVSSSGTYAMDISSGQFSKPDDYQLADVALCYGIDGYTCISNRRGMLYIFAPWGLKKLNLIDESNLDRARFRHFSLAKHPNGKIFIATYGNGLFAWNPQNDSLQHFTQNDPSPLIMTNTLTCVFIDRSGSVWTGSRNGLFKINERKIFRHKRFLPAAESRDESANNIRSVMKDGDKLMFATSDNKVYELSSDASDCRQLALAKANIRVWHTDKRGRLWIGTRGAGLMFNGQSYTKSDKTHQIVSNDILSLCEDQSGRVWIATWENGLLMTQPSDKGVLHFSQFLSRSYGESHVRHLRMDAKQRLWIATENGLYMLNTQQKQINNDAFQLFNKSNGSFPSNEVTCIEIGNDGTVWIGTNTGLMQCHYDDATKRLHYTRITKEDGMVNNSIHQITEDRFGNIWIGTEEGLSCLNSKSHDIRTFIDKDLRANSYTSFASAMLNDGRIVCGTEKGLLIVTPNQQQTNMESLQAAITNVFIDGVSVYERTDNPTRGKSLRLTDKIILNHDDQKISITFSNFDFSERHPRLYRFRLEGYDDQWQSATNSNHADYENMRPGKYVFHLQTYCGADKWSQETLLTVIIRQPWYNTWWAWLIYLMLAAAISSYIYFAWKRNFQLRQQITLDKQLNEFRINFFTQVAHEFRTPLSIIQSAVGNIVRKGKTAPAKTDMQSLERGTKRLLQQVNQLMEFRRINTGNVKIHAQRADIILFVREVFNDFWSLANQKQINYSFTPFAKSFEMPFDSEKMEQIVYNLISNAIKYTPDKGTISVKIRLKTDETDARSLPNIVLSVEDNGPGISKQQREQMFKPFMNGMVAKGGMGIGLYIAHQMAVAHHGTLTFEDAQPGCIFCVTLPTTESAYAAEELQPQHTKTVTTQPTTALMSEISAEMSDKPMNDRCVLIIEDNLDMLQQIRKLLSTYLETESATTGYSAMERLKEKTPDIILCDIKLPDTNGIDLIRVIKANEQLARVPIIILTAIDDEAVELRALQAGANDYLIKPCSPNILITKTLRLIEFSLSNANTSTDKEEAAPLITNKSDEIFLNRMHNIIDHHIAEPDFDIQKLTELMGMSRTKIFYKIKKLCGSSPNEYIQNLRLDYAARLLKEGELSVAEISYMAGFQSAAYFSRRFKQKFGMSPSRFQSGKEEKE